MAYRLLRQMHRFKTPFRLAHGTRTGTDAVLLVLQQGNLRGYGESTFPPYLPERPEAATEALEKALPAIDLSALKDTATIARQADEFALSPFTRNILVNALLDLYLRQQGLSAAALYKGPGTHVPRSTFTLTKTDDPEEKRETAGRFALLKLKLDGTDDVAFAARVKEKLNKPFCVDANQGWKDAGVEQAAAWMQELKAQGCVLVEQPFEKSDHEKHAALRAMKILPVYADEGLQGEEEFARWGHCYDGVNIKLQKCGGLDRALAWAEAVRRAGKNIIAGCMSESSGGCAAALALKPLADYLDLDGPWLMANDPFTGLRIEKGDLFAEGELGFGVELGLDAQPVKG